MSSRTGTGISAAVTGTDAAPLVLGISSVLAQVVVLRETADSFQGNELSYGIVLGGWLFWTAAGTFAGGRLFDRYRAGPGTLIVLLCSLAWLFPASLFLVRAARVLWRLRPGEVVGLSHVFGISFIVLAPLCLMLGAVFPAAVRWAAGSSRRQAEERGGAAGWINRAYILETLGFIAGGLAFNFVLVWYAGAWTAVLITAGLDLAAAGWVFAREKKTRCTLFPAVVCVVTALFWCALMWGTWSGRLDEATQRLRWRGSDLVQTETSPYGSLAAVRDREQVTFYESGLLVATVPAPSTTEPFYHLPLVLHSAPRKVLVLGGGIGGGLREVLKHPVSSVDYVCLNPSLVKFMEAYLPPDDVLAMNDPRLTMRYEDGCGYVRSLAARPEDDRPRYDLMFLSLPDPSTARINRAYSLEFFRAVKKLLAPDGILALELSFSDTYVGTEMRRLSGSIYKTLARVFPRVVPVPEYTILWLASPSGDGVELASGPAEERYHERQLRTVYLTPEMIHHKLDATRIADRLNFLLADYTRLFESPDPLQEELAAWRLDPAIPVNRDFHPISYYLHMILWVSKFSKKAGRLMEWVAGIRPAALAGSVLAVLMILAAVAYGTRQRPERMVVPVVVLGNGFTAMVTEVLLLFGFQVLTGYVFSQVALIISLFMAGLMAGSIVSARYLVPRNRPLTLLLGAEAVMIVFLLALPGGMDWLAAVEHLPVVKLVVAVLVAAAGFLDGVEFPLGSCLLAGPGGRVGTSAGIVYGADLAGSFLGAVLVSGFLLPVLGLAGTCLLVITLKLGTMAMLGAAALRR